MLSNTLTFRKMDILTRKQFVHTHTNDDSNALPYVTYSSGKIKKKVVSTTYAVLTDTHNPCSKQNCQPHFSLYKVGFKGVYTAYTC